MPQSHVITVTLPLVVLRLIHSLVRNHRIDSTSQVQAYYHYQELVIDTPTQLVSSLGVPFFFYLGDKDQTAPISDRVVMIITMASRVDRQKESSSKTWFRRPRRRWALPYRW